MNARHNPSGSSWTSRIARARGAWPLLLAAGLVALPGTADAARVKGRFDGFRTLQNPVWAEAKDPKNHGYSFREPVPTVRAEFRRPFPFIPKELCIAAIASGAQKAQPPVLIRVGGGRTTPVTIVVTPGYAPHLSEYRSVQAQDLRRRYQVVRVERDQAGRHARLVGARRGRVRDPRRGRSEPSHVDRRRAERGSGCVPVDEGRIFAERE